jgi:AraC-like DNA-binding protein
MTRSGRRTGSYSAVGSWSSVSGGPCVKTGQPSRWKGSSCSAPPPPRNSGPGVYGPAFCVIAQGTKEVLLGENRYRYDPARYLVSTAALPVAAHVTEASREKPYLGLLLRLDPALVGSVVVEASQPAPRGKAPVTAIGVSLLDAGLLDAVLRLVRLVESPDDARILGPLVKREIVYRLLKGEQSDRLHHVSAVGGHAHRIGQAIERLRGDFDRTLRVEDVARELGMSVSSFHHLKAVTAMSPLRFQKQIRLQEARRLMLAEDLDATSAGCRVGYGNVSHFNRDYKRLFGAPPARDAERLRDGAGGSTTS